MSAPAGYAKSEAKAYARKHIVGLWGATFTPFTPDLALDEAGFRANLRHWSGALAVDGLFVSGKRGEFFSLSLEERKRTFEIAVEERRTEGTVMVSCSDTNLSNVLALVRHAEAVGADFVVVQSPIFYFGHDEETVYGYHRILSESTRLGIAMWNNPDHGYVMSDELVGRIADLPNIVSIKDSVERPQYASLTRSAGSKLIVSTPDEAAWLGNIVELGWRALVATPDVLLMMTPTDQRLREYTALALAGDTASAKVIRDSLEPVRRALRGAQPRGKAHAFMKYWLELQGQVGGPVRPPLLQLTETEREAVRTAYETSGIGRSGRAFAG